METIEEKYLRVKRTKETDYTGKGVTRDSKEHWGYNYDGNHVTGFRTYEEACHELKLIKYTKQLREIRELAKHYPTEELKKLILMKSYMVEIPVRSVTINGGYEVSGQYKTGKGRHMYLSEKARKFKKKIRSIVREDYEGRMLSGPIKLTMHNFYKFNYGRDVGNPNKFIQDALEKVVYENDVEVFEGLDRKVENCKSDGLTIIVEEILPDETIQRV